MIVAAQILDLMAVPEGSILALDLLSLSLSLHVNCLDVRGYLCALASS